MKGPVLSKEQMRDDEEAFPLCTPEEMDAIRSVGKVQSLLPEQSVYEAGQRPIDFFVVVSGEIDIVDTSSDEDQLIVTHGAGAVMGDINAFAGRPAAASARARVKSEVIRLTIEQVRHLLVQVATLNEKWMAALVRRRELVLASGYEGLRIFGDHADPATLRLREFLYRNGVAHHWIDTAVVENCRVFDALQQKATHWPAVVWRDQLLFQNPSLNEVAERFGLHRAIPDEVFDTVIIGSGPAGLGAAVYAASEGLKTLVLDRVGPGGQAGDSSRIENYPGFPLGLSGHDLGLRCYVQALKFGAQFSAPVNVTGLECAGEGLHKVLTDDGSVVRTKTVILSPGVTYRGLKIEGLRELRGAGVYYSATQVEALLCQHKPVHIIGAGNSAGQAAMYLSKFAKCVHLIVRGTNLHKSMSSYLAERVLANSRVKIRFQCELKSVNGGDSLQEVQLETKPACDCSTEPSGGVFVFTGASPCTDFLGDVIRKDEQGYIITGADAAASGGWPLKDRSPCALETTCPGVFAAGDCRSRTTKRVAFAIGDGALAVTCVHDFLGTYR